MPREARASGPVAPEIVVQCDIGGMTIAFTELVSGADEAKINDRLDLFARTIGRQRARITLTEKLVDLLANEKATASLPERKREHAKARAAERARIVASWEAQHQVSSKRVVDFKMSDQQRKALLEFDQQSESDLRKLDAEAEALALQRPLLDAQIARLRAVIAGGDPLAPLEAEQSQLQGERLAEAAD